MKGPVLPISLFAFIASLLIATWMFPAASIIWLSLLVSVPVAILATGMLWMRKKQQLEFQQELDNLIHLLDLTGEENTESLIRNQLPEGKLADLFLKLQKQQQENRQFTQNATHELQTPLAVMKGNVELMLQLPSLGEKEARALSIILQNINRLSKINSSLILLSKIENNRYSDEEWSTWERSWPLTWNCSRI